MERYRPAEDFEQREEDEKAGEGRHDLSEEEHEDWQNSVKAGAVFMGCFLAPTLLVLTGTISLTGATLCFPLFTLVTSAIGEIATTCAMYRPRKRTPVGDGFVEHASEGAMSDLRFWTSFRATATIGLTASLFLATVSYGITRIALGRTTNSVNEGGRAGRKDRKQRQGLRRRLRRANLQNWYDGDAELNGEVYIERDSLEDTMRERIDAFLSEHDDRPRAEDLVDMYVSLGEIRDMVRSAPEGTKKTMYEMADKLFREKQASFSDAAWERAFKSHDEASAHDALANTVVQVINPVIEQLATAQGKIAESTVSLTAEVGAMRAAMLRQEAKEPPKQIATDIQKPKPESKAKVIGPPTAAQAAKRLAKALKKQAKRAVKSIAPGQSNDAGVARQPQVAVVSGQQPKSQVAEVKTEAMSEDEANAAVAKAMAMLGQLKPEQRKALMEMKYSDSTDHAGSKAERLFDWMEEVASLRSDYRMLKKLLKALKDADKAWKKFVRYCNRAYWAMLLWRMWLPCTIFYGSAYDYAAICLFASDTWYVCMGVVGKHYMEAALASLHITRHLKGFFEWYKARHIIARLKPYLRKITAWTLDPILDIVDDEALPGTDDPIWSVVGLGAVVLGDYYNTDIMSSLNVVRSVISNEFTMAKFATLDQPNKLILGGLVLASASLRSWKRGQKMMYSFKHVEPEKRPYEAAISSTFVQGPTLPGTALHINTRGVVQRPEDAVELKAQDEAFVVQPSANLLKRVQRTKGGAGFVFKVGDQHLTAAHVLRVEGVESPVQFGFDVAVDPRPYTGIEPYRLCPPNEIPAYGLMVTMAADDITMVTNMWTRDMRYEINSDGIMLVESPTKGGDSGTAAADRFGRLVGVHLGSCTFMGQTRNRIQVLCADKNFLDKRAVKPAQMAERLEHIQEHYGGLGLGFAVQGDKIPSSTGQTPTLYPVPGLTTFAQGEWTVPSGGYAADEKQMKAKYSYEASVARDTVNTSTAYTKGWKAVTAVCFTIMLLYNNGTPYKEASHDIAVELLNERESSKGFPLKKYYQFDEPLQSEDYRRLSTALVDFYNEHGYTPNICELFNKQELIKIQKLLAGDQRKICNVSKDLQYWFVRAGWEWHKAHQQMYHTGPFALGINPASYDWDLLYARHNKFSTHFSADVKGCEFTFTTQDIRNLFVVRKNVSDPSLWPLLDMLECSLTEKIVKSAAGTAEFCPALNPSGVYDTTVNTDLHVLRMFMSYLYTVIGEEVSAWEEHCALTMYGDNLLISYSAELKELGFSPEGLTAYLRTEGKTIKCSPTSLLTECEFLSMGFVPFYGRVMYTTKNRTKLLMSLTYTKTGKVVDPEKHANKIFSIWRFFVFGTPEDYSFVQQVATDMIAKYGQKVPVPKWVKQLASLRISQTEAQLKLSGMQAGPGVTTSAGLKALATMPPKSEKKEIKKEAKKEEKKRGKPKGKKRQPKKKGLYKKGSADAYGQGATLDARAAAKMGGVEYANAKAWTQALFDPFTAGIGVRVPDSGSMLPTYTMPMYARGTLSLITPSSQTNAGDIVAVMSPDPYYGVSQLVSETTLGAFTSGQLWGAGTTPTNLAFLTANAAVYRTTSCAIRVYNDAPIQTRGGSWQVANVYQNSQIGGSPFSGFTSANLNSMIQTVKGDCAAIGGKGITFNWVPGTDRNTVVPYTAQGTFGFTALAWRAPAFVSNGFVGNTSACTDSVLVFRASTPTAATTSLSLQYEVIWNVEFIPLVASESSVPGKCVVGSESMVTNEVVAIEQAGSKPVAAQIEVPGASMAAMERGGVPAGTADPTPITSNPTASGDAGGGVLGMLGKVAKSALKQSGPVGVAMDLMSGEDLMKHRIAVYMGRLDLSPVSQDNATNYARHCRRPCRLPWSIPAEHAQPLPEWFEWFSRQIAQSRKHPSDEVKTWQPMPGPPTDDGSIVDGVIYDDGDAHPPLTRAPSLARPGQVSSVVTGSSEGKAQGWFGSPTKRPQGAGLGPT